MQCKSIVAVIALAAALATCEAEAQLFRGSAQRQMPRFSRLGASGTQPGGADEGVGLVSGSERYVRGSRSETDFVGADSRDLESFVGMQQTEGTGQIRSAIAGSLVQGPTRATANTPPPASPSRGMYQPQLAVGFEFTRPASLQLAVRLARQLDLSPAIRPTKPIEVSVEGQTATLRGEVASEHERRLAALMARFEPGISEVRNELTVMATMPPPPALPGPSPPPLPAADVPSGPREF